MPFCYKQVVTQSQSLSQEKLVWIQFSFSKSGCLSEAKELSLPCYLLIAAEQEIGSCLSQGN